MKFRCEAAYTAVINKTKTQENVLKQIYEANNATAAIKLMNQYVSAEVPGTIVRVSIICYVVMDTPCGPSQCPKCLKKLEIDNPYCRDCNILRLS
jgi:hypothetical protein